MKPPEYIARALLKVRQKSPFFAVLLLFADIQASQAVATAATDGRRIFYNPSFLEGLGDGGVEAVLLHEVLHCALNHVYRRATRDPATWNYAADIVVNGIIAADGSFPLPEGAVRQRRLEHLSAEEVYAILLSKKEKPPAGMILDLLAPPRAGERAAGSCDDLAAVTIGETLIDQSQVEEIAAHWAQAIENARLIAERHSADGSMPGEKSAGIDLLLKQNAQSQVDWRSELWRFLVRTPTDYQGYDRRFIHAGLYLDDLAGESVRVYVAIDTSGSISNELLAQFIAELTAIVRSYPSVICNLYYADAALFGPWRLDGESDIPTPKGGGGTSFAPFFEAMRTADPTPEDLMIYFTDGYGRFPVEKPEGSVLWLVAPGGLASPSFPFGNVVRLHP